MNKEELKKIKEELISQIDSWQASDEQKQAAKEQISSLPDDKFEEFLAKNNVIQRDKSECPFCLIKEGKISSYKIGESKNALAVLEINPLSRGHVIIIPGKHQEGKPEEEVNKFAEQIAQDLKEKLKPKDVKVYGNQIQGHTIINVVPNYGEKQERKKAENKELEEMQKFLKQEAKQKEEPKAPVKQQTQEEEKRLPKAPVRIP